MLMKRILTNCWIILSCLLACASAMAQTGRQIKGLVTDEQGAPLIGVGIFIKGTSVGTVSDVDGSYVLSLGDRTDPVVTFSYVGMKTVDVTVTASMETLNVTMEGDTDLDAVIVQGYGRVQKREDLIGSAFQVNSEDLEFKPMTRLDNILDGMVPGMVVSPNTDGPSTVQQRYNIRIRGEASLSASNEPLWIIDGVPVYTGTRTNIMPGLGTTISPLSFVSPEDVESITVLKDAAEVSIYGADGANGVILVTTKGGEFNSGPTKVNATFRYGVSAIDESTRFKTLNAAQYMAYAKEAWANGGNDPALFPYQDNDMNTYSTTDTYWPDLYFGLGQNFLASIAISGGSQNTANYVSASYYREQSSVKGNLQHRITARLNNTYRLGRKFIFRPQISASYNINDIFSPSHEYYEILPIFSLFDNDGYTYRLYNKYVSGRDPQTGELIWDESKFLDNTIADRELNDNTQKTFLTEGNLSLQYEVLEGLTATAQFGVSYQHGYETMYESRNTLGGIIDGEPKGYSTRNSANYLSWANIERVNFNRTFGKHAVSALAGVELSSKGYNTITAYGSGFVNDSIQEVGYAEESTRKGSSSMKTTRKLSLLAQAGYTFDSRYSLQFSIRREGNSSFGKYARWATYFSAGGAWNIHREHFFNSKIIDLLKLKVSFGTTGNSRVDSAQMRGLGTFSYSDTYSYNGEMGGVVATPANPGISWETTYKTNVGTDIRLWDRLSVAAEFYYDYTTNLLSKVYTSRVIGDERIYANVGEMYNLGYEVTVNSVNIANANFHWTTDLNLSHNRNRVVKLADGKSITSGSSITAEGYDSDSFYLVRWAGVDPTTGAPMWYDKNGNLTYTYSTADRVIYKSSSPVLTGGMTNTFRLYDFSLSFQLNYSIGGYALCTLGTNGVTDGYDIIGQNVSVNSLDHWSKPGDLSPNPRISTVSSSSSRHSTRFLYNKTNVRLQNLALTYTLPERISSKLKMSSMRISFIGDNLYLWTPDQKRNRNSYKTMMYGYPLQRTFSLSLDMTF